MRAPGSARRGAGDAGASRRPEKARLHTTQPGDLYRVMGDLDRALDCFRQCDEITRIHLLPIQRSFHLTSLAHIQLLQGHIETALQTYREAVDLSRRARYADGLVQSLRMLGNALVGLARYDEALPCLQEAALCLPNWKTRCRRPRCGPASPESSNPGRQPTPHTRGASCWRSSGSAVTREVSWTRVRGSREPVAPKALPKRSRHTRRRWPSRPPSVTARGRRPFATCSGCSNGSAAGMPRR